MKSSAIVDHSHTAPVETEPHLSLIFARVGAVSYVLWSLWHVVVLSKIYDTASAMAEGPLPARLLQNGWYLLGIMLATALIAITMNWHNSRRGYWLNLAINGWAELGLFLIFMLPGAFPWLPTGWVGPLRHGELFADRTDRAACTRSPAASSLAAVQGDQCHCPLRAGCARGEKRDNAKCVSPCAHKNTLSI